jgi:hypothetical protein
MPAGQLGDLLPDRWQAAHSAKAALLLSPSTETTSLSTE